MFEVKGFNVIVFFMNDFKLNNLKKFENLLIVVSIYGEGELFDNVLFFYEFFYGC